MCVILFGAGASYGSELYARVPPLGPDLFDELAQFAPSTWGSLPNSWPAKFQEDFEAAMAAFIQAGGFRAPLQWDMADYFYSQFAATHASAYVELLKSLKAKIKEYLFVTINYELMLFQARELAGIPVADFLVCLPHGNSCLFCESISATPGVSFRGGVSTSGRVRPFKNYAEFMSQKTSNAFPPVMSYFEPTKFTVSGASFIDAHRQRFEHAVLSSEKVAIVGVRVHPVDKHIWEPLARTKAQLMYLSGSTAAMDFQTWAANEGRSGDIPVPKYFRDGMSELESFLS